jgi:hypothetical protein
MSRDESPDPHDPDPHDPDADDAGDERDAPEPGALQQDAEVECPECGESVTLALDPEAGASQDWDHDCPVCCRPWRVRVDYDDDGTCTVRVEPA